MQRIERELEVRGIDVRDVPGWPYEYLDPEDELSRAKELAQTRRVSGPRAYEKLVRYLCTRGFTTSVASRAARQVLEERDSQDLVDF
jgi:regulatory protein